MSINSIDGKFSADYFALREDHQPVCTDQFLHGLQVLATQAALAISNPKAVEQAFERIQEAKWEHTSSEAKNDVDQKIQEVRQAWVKVCFGGQFLHVPREHLKKNCGPKFHAQYSSVMKDATEPKLELLPPNGISADVYDQRIVKAFLNYFQTGTLSENALNESILDLISLAHQHQIEGLITKCTDLLKEHFDDHENLYIIWEVANKQKIPQLIFACLSYMQANQDIISTELKEKYEKALPVVKALFTNEIVLNHSPSGNIEVRVEIYNEETASHIEQFSKLFSIRSLVISEKSTDKLLNNSEKLFPFLTKISPTLKDLQELIIWNETQEDQDFLTFKNHFPNLTDYGNDAPFLKTFEEVKTYLDNFRNPDEDDPGSEKLILRSLNLSSLITLDDVQMEEFSPHLQELYHICITSDNITSIVAPEATVIYCSNCIVLSTLIAPKAYKIYCRGCTALTMIDTPKATKIDCRGCTAITIIDAPKATFIDCRDCTNLTTIKAHEATEILCDGCTALTTTIAPKVTKIYCQYCTALTTLDAPEANEINCGGSTSLITIEAQKATEIFCDCCTALTTTIAPKVTKFYCQYCTALTTLDAPEANEIYCYGCTSLITIEAQKATKIDFRCCTTLKTLEAPKASVIDCYGCTTLTNIKAPEANEIKCYGCTALKTIKAPKATEIYCFDCTSLTTIKAPKAIKIDCRGCTSLSTIIAPEAIPINCRGCIALTTLIAPEATMIYCSHCIALTILFAPKATKIDCCGCTALTTIVAPKATEIACGDCTALTIFKAPKATVINCKDCP